MGEVYRARDTKLGRDVAIKVLPEAVAREQERLARFEREGRTLAALNHPNIAIIHGLEDTGGVRALVMELVEGPTLADRIARGPVPPAEALSIARQIVDAFDAAHERGIVHRDLKPANIKITPEGVVKVLDFGLAKAADELLHPDLTQSPTITGVNTRDGVILGTAAYMSPEQARGAVVDKRTDIWAFGCVLYEMLAGRSAFGRDTLSDTLVSILDRDPDWTALPPGTPAHVRALMRRCLEKDQKRRLRDIGDARSDLDAPVADGAEPAGGTRGASSVTAAMGGGCGVAGGTRRNVMGVVVGESEDQLRSTAPTFSRMCRSPPARRANSDPCSHPMASGWRTCRTRAARRTSG
jgi:serine/threonine protein kinase